MMEFVHTRNTMNPTSVLLQDLFCFAGRTAICLGMLFLASLESKADAPWYLFVSDGASNLIRQYDMQGTEVRQIRNPEFNFPTFLAADPENGFLYTDINFDPSGNLSVVKFDLDGNIVARNTSSNIFGMSGGGIVEFIPSRRGTFFVTSTLNTRIAETDRDLKPIRYFPSGATQGGLRTLGGAVSLDGQTLYVADADGQSDYGFIRVYNALSGLQVGVITNSGLEFPFAVRIGPTGRIYVSDRGGVTNVPDRILVFETNQVFIKQFRSGAPITYNFGPFDILPDGELALLETNFETQTPIRFLTAQGDFVKEFGDGLRNAYGIAFMPAPGPGRTCPQTLRIRASVDGHSKLIIRPGGLFWINESGDRPAATGTLLIPNSLSETQWNVTWPSTPQTVPEPSGTNRLPIFMGLGPIVVLQKSGRGGISISQQPNFMNRSTLIVDFDDCAFAGADFYDLTLCGLTIGTTLQVEVSQVRLSWTSDSNFFYQVQSRSTASSLTWTNFAEPIVGTGSNMTFLAPVTSPQQIFRISVSPVSE
jgi:hypothetical protein